MSSRSAAGVVVRRRRGRAEVLLVHRYRQDDWVLPKGHLLRSESYRSAALREVSEESGWVCSAGRRLCEVSRTDRRGRRRRTVYFEMRPLHLGSSTDTECDDRLWLTLPKASRLVSSPGDAYALRVLLDNLEI